jgi:5-methylcytosine-specific restriction protein A
MRIRDLPAPVTATKADWLPGTTWLGFTPQGQGPSAAAQCQSTVRRQFGKGYVLERITQAFGEPNARFASDPQVKEDREKHEKLKGRLVAVHRLRVSARPLAEIIGKADFERLQDIWGSNGERRRWSVAFPIVESYDIVGQPRAHDVFDDPLFRRLYQSQSATLRLLDDEVREAIADLKLARAHAANAWIAIEDEIAMAEASDISSQVRRAIERDLLGALEGETEERRTKMKKRAAWLANGFVSERRKAGRLVCDECGFDPQSLPDACQINARSCFDVHHISLLEEGARYTTTADFALLCPTCHRIAHLRLQNRQLGPK